MRKYILFFALITLLISIQLCSMYANYFCIPCAPFLNKYSVILSIKPLCQYPDFPTGCEVTAAITVLHYWEETISISDFIDQYLPMNSSFYKKEGVLYGPDPNHFFIGDPREKSSYGCFSPVIYTALSNYFGSSERICNTSGVSLKQLCKRYIDNQIPVILWASSNMAPLKEGKSWHLSTGEKFTWMSGEHCLVFIGYNEADYFFCDPKYSVRVAYPRKIVEQRYQELGQQSLVILPK